MYLCLVTIFRPVQLFSQSIQSLGILIACNLYCTWSFCFISDYKHTTSELVGRKTKKLVTIVQFQNNILNVATLAYCLKVAWCLSINHVQLYIQNSLHLEMNIILFGVLKKFTLEKNINKNGSQMPGSNYKNHFSNYHMRFWISEIYGIFFGIFWGLIWKLHPDFK